MMLKTSMTTIAKRMLMLQAQFGELVLCIYSRILLHDLLHETAFYICEPLLLLVKNVWWSSGEFLNTELKFVVFELFSVTITLETARILFFRCFWGTPSKDPDELKIKLPDRAFLLLLLLLSLSLSIYMYVFLCLCLLIELQNLLQF